MNKIPFYLVLLFACTAAAMAAEPKRARIKMTDGPKRIQRPAVPEYKPTSGASLKGALNPDNFAVGDEKYSHSLSVDSEALYATERSWLPSRAKLSAGTSDVGSIVTIALCPPSNPEQRDAWKTLMIELADPKVSGAWRDWQERVCKAVLNSRILGQRLAGQSYLHLKITRDEAVEVRPVPHTPFGQAVDQEVQRLAATGVFKIPAVSETTEVHAMVVLVEQDSKNPQW